MEKKDKITSYLKEIKSNPERYKKLREFTLSKMSEEEKKSPVFISLLDLKMRQVLCEYFD